VASLKEFLKQPNISRLEKEHHTFLLGYSYFLKAKAELTFLEARKQGIVLKDDFSAQESQLFTVVYFHGKAHKSLNKSAIHFNGWPQVRDYIREFTTQNQA
jgi:hypothetical protein